MAKDFEARARDRLEPAVYDYYAGGADDQVSVNDNPRAWQRVRLRPRVLRDVTAVDTTVTMLGATAAAPIGIAPTAAHELAHPDAECATARGAAAAGVPYVVSTLSTRSMEAIAEAASDAARWFQLYVRGDLDRARALVQRAEACGHQALVVTVDVPTLGLRRHEAMALNDRVGLPHMARPDDTGGDTYARHVALTFDDLHEIISWTSLPVLAKGVLRADDAAACVRAGVAGIIVSNHGGRQLDTTIDPPTALEEVAAAVGDATEIYVDGGIRRGTDVVKALALGAVGVFVGRPVIWGLVVDGADGVCAVLDELRTELERAMRLCGAATVADVTHDLVVGP
ncbi:MAG: alpha-hydroxy-acid oxidizing protein [Actinobacteria bacterium]|nr:alpha-hydroxy-acid oxidizing protein [Actinomycetota bacterium]